MNKLEKCPECGGSEIQIYHDEGVWHAIYCCNDQCKMDAVRIDWDDKELAKELENYSIILWNASGHKISDMIHGEHKITRSCPFCGEAEKLDTKGSMDCDLYFVSCGSCSSSGPYVEVDKVNEIAKIMITEKWNLNAKNKAIAIEKAE